MHRRKTQARMQISSWQRCGAALLSAVMIYAGSSPAGVGYLPRMGPTPLRFRSAFEADPGKVLPPLDIPDDTATTNAIVPFPPFNEEPAPAPQVAYEPPSQIDLQLPPPPLPAPQMGYATNAPPSVQGVLVPQMLLQYFGHSTNQSSAVIVAPPVEFYPPPPPLSRSSAVYISR